jgi:signal transduction histidine kinase
MLAWCVVLMALGFIAILDSCFNYGELFRAVNSIMFFLVALGLLVRTKIKSKGKLKESLENCNDRLRERMMEMRNSIEAIKAGEPLDEVFK